MNESRPAQAFIRLLPSDVVDQIAAGEVVERPAHLVKELVENAIDAGAKSIEIEYDFGGKRVRVTDDGKGIKEAELALALARHATSKIEIADDLWNLSTFGFRGEALASIAAVSRLTLQSRTADSKTASKVVAEFGKLSGSQPVGGNPGTTILVEDLFANVPARLKFMKSDVGESSQIKSVLRGLALANEGVEFRLRTKGRVEDHWPAADSFLERAKRITGQAKLFETKGTYGDYEAEIAFASPHDISGNARAILIFVQGRPVQDRSLQAAVIEAYRGLLMHGEYPIAIVRLRVPPAAVDVNIHPTKSQVKFQDAQTAFRAVNRTLRAALETAPWLERGEAAARVRESVEEYSQISEQRRSVADLTRPYFAAASTDGAPVSLGENFSERAVTLESSAEASLQTAPQFSVGRFEAPEFNTIQFKQKSMSADIEHSHSSVSDAQIQSQAATPKALGPWSRLQVLGQAHLTYILAQDADRLVLVDQHAAHERVAYERLMRAWMKGEVKAQPLLIPLVVELEPDGAEALVSVSHELEKLGVQLDQSGPQTVAVRQIPMMIKESALISALKTLATEIVERGGSFALEKKISDLCATMACHSVVRAGQALSTEQMKSLLQQMDEFPLSSFCPHGRPVSVDYPYSKLEKDFGRIP